MVFGGELAGGDWAVGDGHAVEEVQVLAGAVAHTEVVLVEGTGVGDVVGGRNFTG